MDDEVVAVAVAAAGAVAVAVVDVAAAAAAVDLPLSAFSVVHNEQSVLIQDVMRMPCKP